MHLCSHARTQAHWIVVRSISICSVISVLVRFALDVLSGCVSASLLRLLWGKPSKHYRVKTYGEPYVCVCATAAAAALRMCVYVCFAAIHTNWTELNVYLIVCQMEFSILGFSCATATGTLRSRSTSIIHTQHTKNNTKIILASEQQRIECEFEFWILPLRIFLFDSATKSSFSICLLVGFFFYLFVKHRKETLFLLVLWFVVCCFFFCHHLSRCLF